MPSPTLTLEQFSAAALAARSGGAGPDREATILLPPSTITRAEDGGQPVVVISMGTPDLARDIVDPAGVSFANYERNPVVLWCHQYAVPPVGRSTRVWKSGNAIMATPEWTSQELHPFGFMIGRMVSEGFLNAASIGIRALEWSYDEERRGVNFAESDMVEWSVCNVPMHPDALVAARSASIDLAPMRAHLEEQLATWAPDSLLLNRAAAEAAVMALRGASVAVPKEFEMALERGSRKKAKCPHCEADVPDDVDECPKCNKPMKAADGVAQAEVFAAAVKGAIEPLTQALTRALEVLQPRTHSDPATDPSPTGEGKEFWRAFNHRSSKE